MSKFKPTIGLEIHAELKTKTKMFCACKNDSDEKEPNKNICPICMGQPGTLPVINKEAVKSVLKVGIALGGRLADLSEFDRKNYFYPDIPKGYQISQYKYPLVSGGELNGVEITRVHLEEDTAKSSHESSEYSLVDFNRAGLPLLELVTEPVMHSGEEVSKFGKELRLLLQYLDVSEANMEKGEMRLEANVSVSLTEKLGTKVEIKNLNSFSSAERGVEFEIKRQTALLEEGGKVMQETRGWDDNKQETFSQRAKEDSHDYRYFPDPDLPKLSIKDIKEFSEENLALEIKETPVQKRGRFRKDYEIKDSDIELFIYNINLSNFFESSLKYIDSTATSYKNDLQTLSNYTLTDVSSLGASGEAIKPEFMAEVVKMISLGEISSRGAKDIIHHLSKEAENPRVLAEEHGLLQKSDTEGLGVIVDTIIKDNPTVTSDYKGGKESSLQFLIGQGMKLSKGSANPAILKDILLKRLKKGL
ncbi:MAG TPA: Asp-tRNA(Asn)/Glu-tRNA(Gln) amidotransferase subunit GatB [Candidatus Paceibacterota bacterium]